MGPAKRTPLVVFLALVTASALFAATGSNQDSRRIESALPGDGALDAPVPAVGTPGGPSRVLTPAELDQWKRGRAIFDKDFKRSEGLGTPELNADSCRACHQDPAIGGAGGLELNVSRFAFDDDGQSFMDLPGGQGLSKLRPPLDSAREEHDPAVADVYEQRQTPSLFGAGLIDAISEATIESNEDPNDSDNDGVRGYARMIDVGTTIEVGRFGWKGQVPRLSDFIRDAMGGECGITTPDDGRGFALAADGDAVADPELSQAEFDDVLFFLSNLAPPMRGGSTDPQVAQGEALFTSIGCATCHVPSLDGVPLFSDLLLHNVAPPAFRGMSEPGAAVGFYRTPPLWGNCRTEPYMHDGAAETTEAAILQHFGEADGARVAFENLLPSEKQALLAFLADL